MENEAGIGKLAKALAAAQLEYTPVKKGAENPFFKSKYASLYAHIAATRPALAKAGLAVVQTTSEGTNGNPVLVTTLIHESGEFLSGYYKLNPVKDDPQGVGSAITYARRYAYSAIVGSVAEDEDDDGEAGTRPAAEKGKKAEKKPDVKPEPKPGCITEAQKQELWATARKLFPTTAAEKMKRLLADYKVAKTEELPVGPDAADPLMSYLNSLSYYKELEQEAAAPENKR